MFSIPRNRSFYVSKYKKYYQTTFEIILDEKFEIIFLQLFLKLLDFKSKIQL